MSRALAFAASAAVLAGAAAAAPAAVVVRTADGAAACALSPARVVCTNRRSPQAVVLSAKAARASRLAVAWSARTPVLSPGSSRSAGPFTCRAAAAAILCTAPGGNGVAASAAQVTVIVAPATASS